MSSNQPENPTGDHKALSSRLQALENLISNLDRKHQKKRIIYWVAGVSLTVVCIFSLASLTSMTFKLDAETVTELGRLEVERHMPEGMKSLRGYLRQEAPHLVSQMLRALLGQLPQLRAVLVEEMDTRTQAATEQFEKDLRAAMTDAIRTTKKNIENDVPGASDAEKLERLVQGVAARFRKNVANASEALYPHYAAELNRIQSFLVDLQRKDESELSEREKVQKEIIETILHLLAREQLQSK